MSAREIIAGAGMPLPVFTASEDAPEVRHYSGVVVVTKGDHIDACSQAIDEMEQAEVHLCHRETSRLVAVLEGRTVAENEAALEQIRILPGVVMAGLVYHYVDDENGSAGATPESARREGAQS